MFIALLLACSTPMPVSALDTAEPPEEPPVEEPVPEPEPVPVPAPDPEG